MTIGVSRRMLFCVLAGMSGLVIGGIAAAYHSAFFPAGLVASVAMVVAYLLALRLLRPGRVLALCGSAGIIASIVALAGSETSGSVFIAANVPGLVFLGVGATSLSVILAWPQASRSKNLYDSV